MPLWPLCFPFIVFIPIIRSPFYTGFFFLILLTNSADYYRRFVDSEFLIVIRLLFHFTSFFFTVRSLHLIFVQFSPLCVNVLVFVEHSKAQKEISIFNYLLGKLNISSTEAYKGDRLIS